MLVMTSPKREKGSRIQSPSPSLGAIHYAKVIESIAEYGIDGIIMGEKRNDYPLVPSPLQLTMKNWGR